MSPQQILNTYVHVRNDDRLDAVPVTESFWAELASGQHAQLDQGRLMTAFTFSEAWGMWERHPAGEELVMLLSGRATMTLQIGDQESEVVFSAPGEYVLVPANTWHTARTDVPTTMLFLTPGAGTEHRPVNT